MLRSKTRTSKSNFESTGPPKTLRATLHRFSPASFLLAFFSRPLLCLAALPSCLLLVLAGPCSRLLAAADDVLPCCWFLQRSRVLHLLMRRLLLMRLVLLRLLWVCLPPLRARLVRLLLLRSLPSVGFCCLLLHSIHVIFCCLLLPSVAFC